MTVNGKRDGFTHADLEAVAQGVSMKRGRAESIYEQVHAAVARWRDFAETAEVDERRARQVESTLRLELPAS
jgi:serine/threonine-protein kinase HipA